MNRSILSVLMLTALATCAFIGCSDKSTVPAAPVSADLLDGATWQYSTDGATFSETPPVIGAKQQAVIHGRITFDVPDVEDVDELELVYDLSPWISIELKLNDKPLAPPVPTMGYRRFAGIDAGLLKPTGNVLTISYGVMNDHDEDRPFPPYQLALNGLTGEDLQVQTGPVLGVFDETRFTVTLRTSMRSQATLRARPTGDAAGPEVVMASPRGLSHRFEAPRHEGYEYRIEATNGAVIRATPWRPVPSWADTADGTLRFVVVGDGRTHVDTWTHIAAAIQTEQPQLVVYVGDMVSAGRNDWEWDTEHFGPGAELFATTPYYPVIGNHEQEAPVMRELFYTASDDGRQWTWAQQIGQVLLIGVVGHHPFWPDTDNYAWLEKTLADSDAKFIFLFSHYPAWSSTRTGAVNEDGEPYDKLTYQGQTVFMPLLAEHNGTAFVVGHDHFYERSELPTGVSTVITGGGGAGLRGRPDDWKANNPYSKVFASRHHYTVFDVAGDTCTMRTIADNGEELDRRVWSARAR